MAGYDVGVRSALNQKGISNDRISYDPMKGVMVDQVSFMKPQKNYQGTSFTDNTGFNTAWDAYNKGQTQQQPAAVQAQPTPNTTQYNPYTSTQTANPYTSQADSVIKQLLSYGQNQQNFDPYSSSQYQAAQAQAQRAAQQNTRAAQEAYGSAGFGRSYALGERAQGIQNDSTEYLMTQVLPQIEAQEQARRQQEYNNILNALTPLMNQQGRADNLVQQDFTNNLSVADRTGTYKPQGADQIISQLLALKGQAETKGVTAADRSVLSGQADTLRAQLQAMGLDPSALGANVNQSNAAIAGSGMGTRTLDGRSTDQNILDSNRNYDRGVFENDRGFNEGVRQADRAFEYTQGRDKVADQRWQAEFDRIKEQDGLQNALAWAGQYLNEDRFKYDQMKDAATAGTTKTVTAATAGDMLSQALQKVVGQDENGNDKYGVFSDPTRREEAFVNMINTTGLRGNDVVTALTKAGYKINEINALQKEYPEVFQ